jgi:hypothetical protein
MHAAPPVLKLLRSNFEIVRNDICPFRLLLSSMKTEADTEIMLCQCPHMMLQITNTSSFPLLSISLFYYPRPENTNVFRFVRSYIRIGNYSYAKAHDTYEELKIA